MAASPRDVLPRHVVWRRLHAPAARLADWQVSRGAALPPPASSRRIPPMDVDCDGTRPSVNCARLLGVVESRGPPMPHTDTVDRPVAIADIAADTRTRLPKTPGHRTHTYYSNCLTAFNLSTCTILPSRHFLDVTKYVASLIFFAITASLPKNDCHLGVRPANLRG